MLDTHHLSKLIFPRISPGIIRVLCKEICNRVPDRTIKFSDFLDTFDHLLWAIKSRGRLTLTMLRTAIRHASADILRKLFDWIVSSFLFRNSEYLDESIEKTIYSTSECNYLLYIIIEYNRMDLDYVFYNSIFYVKEFINDMGLLNRAAKADNEELVIQLANEAYSYNRALKYVFHALTKYNRLSLIKKVGRIRELSNSELWELLKTSAWFDASDVSKYYYTIYFLES